MIPSAEAVNLRDDLERSETRGLVQPVMAMLGSNNWAISKERSATATPSWPTILTCLECTWILVSQWICIGQA